MSKSIDKLRKRYYENSGNEEIVNKIITELETMNNDKIPDVNNSNHSDARELLEEIEKHQKRMQTKSYQALTHIKNHQLEYSVLGLGSGIGLVVVSSTMCFMLIILICLCISSYFYLTKKSSKKK